MVAALEQRGWTAETGAGQSRFPCDVVARLPGADRHQIAILIDRDGRLNTIERFHIRPEVLRAFGWQVAVVISKNWLHETEAVLDRIERLLRREVPEESEPEEGISMIIGF